ncbi:hypothetical protein HS141_16675, partial [Cetobacterium somerae]|uniref:hypothetical protein n=1 Tax=Cetobacterium somerae TaxID=188913 RepID=UPI00211F0E9D
LQNLDDGINSFRQFDTVFYKGISIDIVYNDSLMWFSFEGNPSEEIFNPGVIYTLPNNIKPKSPWEPMSKYLSNDKSISFRINKNGQISMHITSVQTGSNVSFSPADNRAIRAYCCIPYSF